MLVRAGAQTSHNVKIEVCDFTLVTLVAPVNPQIWRYTLHAITAVMNASRECTKKPLLDHGRIRSCNAIVRETFCVMFLTRPASLSGIYRDAPAHDCEPHIIPASARS